MHSTSVMLSVLSVAMLSNSVTRSFRSSATQPYLVVMMGLGMRIVGRSEETEVDYV